MKVFLTTLALILFSHSTVEEWKTLETKEYLIKYPETWILNESGQAGTSFFIFGPAVEGQPFKNNINLMIQDLSGLDIDLAKFVEMSVEQIPQFFPAAVISSSATEGAVHRIVYTATYAEYKLKCKQYYWVKNEKAFVLTYTSDQKSYDESITLATEVMDSFKVK
jgi:hypothetical protein